MTPKELTQIAHELVTSRIQNKETVHMHWVVQELIRHQGLISGDGFAFYSLCAREYVYTIVKKTIDKYDNRSGRLDDLQLNLKGYECLQCAYTVKRDEERILVPIEQLSDDEILDRIAEFRSQQKGLEKHIQELIKYLNDRGYISKPILNVS